MANNVFSFSSGYRPFCSYWWKHQLDWRTWYYPFKYSYQRVTRGWADQDTWSLDSHIAQVLSESIVHLKETTNGYPAGKSIKAHVISDSVDDSTTMEEWKQTLQDISDGFASVQKMDDVPEEFINDWKAIKKYEADQMKTFNKGMKLFHKYFFNLWD